ncbi:MAG TPA: DUF3572 domain-containing protein [Hyphomicrobiaceae bacterium]|nr:DUF3572 domain-containing protein [Hyphomicrobiaceae bacterium]
MHARGKKQAMSQEQAETIGLKALKFLAEDGARLERFLALTGVGPADLKRSASSPSLLQAVLEHLLSDESLLLVFASESDVAPAEVEPASRVLAGAR